MKRNEGRHILVRLMAGCIFLCASLCLPINAQTFAPPSCGISQQGVKSASADSTCYSGLSNAQSSCVDPNNTPPAVFSASNPYYNASQQVTCGGAGFYGTATQYGHRNMCTGVTTWQPLQAMNEKCTNCPNPLSGGEGEAIVGAIMELNEGMNQGLAYIASNGYQSTFFDGTDVLDPLTNQVTGKYFREHVWVIPEKLSSGQLPAVPRLNYLMSINQMPASFPAAFPGLPTDSNGNAITNSGLVYEMALDYAISNGITSCINNDNSHCNTTCSAPAAGWIGTFCAVKPVTFLACSDSYAVNSGSGWTPTSNATVPFKTSGNPGPGDYSPTNWDWQTILGWNGQPNTGGNVFMCESTINTCSGWTTQASDYRCKIPANFDCSYVDPNTGNNVAATCSTCSISQGAVWDYWLTQGNDCPLAPGLSTRSSQNQTRNLWQSDLPSCVVSPGAPPPPSTPPTCNAPAYLNATGTGCTCSAPAVYNASTKTCDNPTPPPAPTGSCINNPPPGGGCVAPGTTQVLANPGNVALANAAISSCPYPQPSSAAYQCIQGAMANLSQSVLVLPSQDPSGIVTGGYFVGSYVDFGTISCPSIPNRSVPANATYITSRTQTVSETAPTPSGQFGLVLNPYGAWAPPSTDIQCLPTPLNPNGSPTGAPYKDSQCIGGSLYNFDTNNQRWLDGQSC